MLQSYTDDEKNKIMNDIEKIKNTMTHEYNEQEIIDSINQTKQFIRLFLKTYYSKISKESNGPTLYNIFSGNKIYEIAKQAKNEKELVEYLKSIHNDMATLNYTSLQSSLNKLIYLCVRLLFVDKIKQAASTEQNAVVQSPTGQNATKIIEDIDLTMNSCINALYIYMLNRIIIKSIENNKLRVVENFDGTEVNVRSANIHYLMNALTITDAIENISRSMLNRQNTENILLLFGDDAYGGQTDSISKIVKECLSKYKQKNSNSLDEMVKLTLSTEVSNRLESISVLDKENFKKLIKQYNVTNRLLDAMNIFVSNEFRDKIKNNESLFKNSVNAFKKNFNEQISEIINKDNEVDTIVLDKLFEKTCEDDTGYIQDAIISIYDVVKNNSFDSDIFSKNKDLSNDDIKIFNSDIAEGNKTNRDIFVAYMLINFMKNIKSFFAENALVHNEDEIYATMFLLYSVSKAANRKITPQLEVISPGFCAAYSSVFVNNMCRYKVYTKLKEFEQDKNKQKYSDQYRKDFAENCLTPELYDKLMNDLTRRNVARNVIKNPKDFFKVYQYFLHDEFKDRNDKYLFNFYDYDYKKMLKRNISIDKLSKSILDESAFKSYNSRNIVSYILYELGEIAPWVYDDDKITMDNYMTICFRNIYNKWLYMHVFTFNGYLSTRLAAKKEASVLANKPGNTKSEDSIYGDLYMKFRETAKVVYEESDLNTEILSDRMCTFNSDVNKALSMKIIELLKKNIAHSKYDNFERTLNIMRDNIIYMNNNGDEQDKQYKYNSKPLYSIDDPQSAIKDIREKISYIIDNRYAAVVINNYLALFKLMEYNYLHPNYDYYINSLKTEYKYKKNIITTEEIFNKCILVNDIENNNIKDYEIVTIQAKDLANIEETKNLNSNDTIVTLYFHKKFIYVMYLFIFAYDILNKKFFYIDSDICEGKISPSILPSCNALYTEMYSLNKNASHISIYKTLESFFNGTITKDRLDNYVDRMIYADKHKTPFKQVDMIDKGVFALYTAANSVYLDENTYQDETKYLDIVNNALALYILLMVIGAYVFDKIIYNIAPKHIPFFNYALGLDIKPIDSAIILMGRHSIASYFDSNNKYSYFDSNVISHWRRKEYTDSVHNFGRYFIANDIGYVHKKENLSETFQFYYRYFKNTQLEKDIEINKLETTRFFGGKNKTIYIIAIIAFVLMLIIFIIAIIVVFIIAIKNNNERKIRKRDKFLTSSYSPVVTTV